MLFDILSDERLEDLILTKLDQKQTNKPNIIEQLGQCMTDAGNDFGPTMPYGSTLIKCGQTHQKLGLVYKDFIQSSAMGYMQPLKSFLEGEMKSITVGNVGESDRILFFFVFFRRKNDELWK